VQFDFKLKILHFHKILHHFDFNHVNFIINFFQLTFIDFNFSNFNSHFKFDFDFDFNED
jgi:tRNA A-37 threonylcarbamoyl transferase component Bud32